MKYDCDEKIIKTALDTIHTPKYDINFEIEKKIKKKSSRIYLSKPRLVILSISLFIILSAGVAADTMDSFNNLISLVSPEIALLLQPIGAISEDNGIRVEVVGAIHDDEMAAVYFTMQDLVGNRIDETIDIYNYSLSGARMFNIQVVNYDETTKTATLRMEANGGKKLNGKKVRFSISSFLSDKIIFDGVDTGVNLLDVQETNASRRVSLDMNHISGGGGELYGEFEEKGVIDLLKTDEMNMSLPNIDFMHISNMGYIDEYLHIQTKWTGNGIDDHGFLYFVDSLGNKIDNKSANIYFGTDELGNTEYGNDYVEYIFDMKNINMDEIKLKGDFFFNGNYIEGNWKAAFKLQSVEEKQTDCSIKSDTWEINSVSVSPMGVTLVGKGKIEDLQGRNPSITMTDGSGKTFYESRSYMENDEFRLKFLFHTPLDISKVESVTIDGQVIDLRK